jgi:hypothetical protein
VSHSATYFAISRFILVHKKFFFKPWYILFVLGWIEYLEQCASSIIFRWSSKSFGTTRRFLNHNTPWASSWKYFASPNCYLLLMCPIPSSIFYAVMTSSLIDGMRARLCNTPWGITQRLGSSGSPPDVTGWIMMWLQWSWRLRASAATLAFLGW